MRLRKGDTVLVIAGKDRGKQGKVRQVLPQEGRLVVEGANKAKRHQRAQGTVRQAGIVELEVPIPISNVRLLCPKCHRPARASFRLLGDGTKVRHCHKCGEALD